MNNLRKILFLALTIGFTASVFFSCEDDFTEEDLLNLQNDLALQNDTLQAARNAAALNEAGELVSYLVKVVSNNNDPVEGASVSLLAAVDGTPSTTTLTTDADGQVYFESVVIGGNVLSISATGFFAITADVNFGQISEGTHYEIINGEVIPLQVVESSILPLFSDGTGADVATLTGVVQIETDLTNDTTEVVDGVEILADLSNFATLFARDGSLVPSLYVFDSDLNIGRATSDANGSYTMQIPTTADGLQPRIIVPTITRTQRLAANEVDNVPLDRPEYFDVETQFGPGLGSSDIPDVPGVFIQSSAPSAAGSGFTVGLTRYGRGITTGTLILGSFTSPTEFSGGDIIYQVTTVGEGYENSPAVSITDASGTDATIEAHIRFAISGLTVATAGDAVADTDVSFDLVYDEVEHDGSGSTDTTANQTAAGGILTVRSDGSGAIVADSVAAALAQAIADDDTYFDPEDPQLIADWISGLRLVGTGAGATTDPVITVSAASGVVEQIAFLTAGEDYVSPTLAFTGGGAATQAAITVVEFGTQWIITPDNSGVTTAYNVLPEQVNFEYTPVNTGTKAVLESEDLANEVTAPETGATAGDLVDILTFDGSNNIVLNDQINTWTTNFFSGSQPRVLVTDPQAIPAVVEPNAGFFVDDNGGITDDRFDYTVDNQGSGYTDRPAFTVLPAADGAPGSGAQMIAVDGDFEASGEFDWFGELRITNVGSGYLENLNQASEATYQGTQSNSSQFVIFVRSGETFIHNIDYGTGVRVQEYD